METPTGPRDYGRLAQYARARLIVAAASRGTLDYGELSRFSHLSWYSSRVLRDGVFRECEQRGESDLTGLLVRRGEQPEDAELAEQVWAYWRGVQE
jgi:hypothetical protein